MVLAIGDAPFLRLSLGDFSVFRSQSEDSIWLRPALLPPGGAQLHRLNNQHRLLRRLCQAKKLLALGPTTEFSDRLLVTLHVLTREAMAS